MLWTGRLPVPPVAGHTVTTLECNDCVAQFVFVPWEMNALRSWAGSPKRQSRRRAQDYCVDESSASVEGLQLDSLQAKLNLGGSVWQFAASWSCGVSTRSTFTEVFCV